MNNLKKISGITNRKHKFIYSTLCVLGSMTLGSQFASAQVLEEIVVTAQKRVQSLQDVPISVTAISGAKIQRDGIQRLDDLSIYVPNLTVREGFAGETIAIRGFGSNQNPSFEQAVSTFIDGVYFGRGKQSLASFLDLERVEVLRGPQSTFFGNNAIAGALNLTTKKPGDENEGYVNVSYNPDDSEMDIQAAYGGPISKNLSGRIAIKYLDSDGWLDSFSGGRVPEKESVVGRASFLWQANDNVDVFFKAELGREDTTGATSQIVDCGPNSSFTPAPTLGHENSGNGLCDLATNLTGVNFEFDELIETGGLNPQTVIPIPDANIVSVLAQENGEFRNLDTANANLTVNWQLDSGATVTSITGYTAYDSVRQFDVDSTPLASISTNRREEFDQFSQELRIVSPGGEKIDWLGGIYYQTNNVDFDYQTYTLIDTPDGSDLGGPLGGNGVHGPVLVQFAGDFQEEADTTAIFGSFTYNASDRMRATVGLRYSEVNKDAVSVLNLGLTNNQAAQPVASAASNIHFVGSPAGPLFIAHTARDSISSKELTGQINLQYDISDSIMIYLTLANGFKAGGFDNLIRLPETYPTTIGLRASIAGQSSGGSFTFDQEDVKAVELGLKMEWDRVRLNLALFNNEFTDLQQSIFNTTAVAFQIRNAGAATSRGIEGDLEWAISDSLRMTFGASILDAKYDSFPNASCDRGSTNRGVRSCDLSGAYLPHVPSWNAIFGFNHNMNVNENMELITNLSVSFSDGYRTGVELDPRFEIDSFERVDLRVALADIGGNWDISLWGKNLTDELLPGISTYGAVRSVGPYLSTTQRPLSWGVSGSYRF